MRALALCFGVRSVRLGSTHLLKLRNSCSLLAWMFSGLRASVRRSLAFAVVVMYIQKRTSVNVFFSPAVLPWLDVDPHTKTRMYRTSRGEHDPTATNVLGLKLRDGIAERRWPAFSLCVRVLTISFVKNRWDILAVPNLLRCLSPQKRFVAGRARRNVWTSLSDICCQCQGQLWRLMVDQTVSQIMSPAKHFQNNPRAGAALLKLCDILHEGAVIATERTTATARLSAHTLLSM